MWWPKQEDRFISAGEFRGQVGGGERVGREGKEAGEIKRQDIGEAAL